MSIIGRIIETIEDKAPGSPEESWRRVIDQLMEIARELGLEGMTGIIEPLYGGLPQTGLGGYAPDIGKMGGGYIGPFINCIPSSVKGACTPDLLVLCF